VRRRGLRPNSLERDFGSARSGAVFPNGTIFTLPVGSVKEPGARRGHESGCKLQVIQRGFLLNEYATDQLFEGVCLHHST